MVRIRLKRTGTRNQSCFRVVVMDQRSSRDGKAIEELGYY
ncbi:MAG: 30S ribosomal protein S16, partial [Lentisphaeria bacterium]|nr:30S ribosomal protein S16 [Lentisphaeria bacterium]